MIVEIDNNDEEDPSLSDLLEKLTGQEGWERLEGTSGVHNLCRIVNALGYQDEQHFGQFHKGCYGDLIHFLEDNPGAIEAVYNWICEQDLPMWRVEVQERLDPEQDEEVNEKN